MLVLGLLTTLAATTIGSAEQAPATDRSGAMAIVGVGAGVEQTGPLYLKVQAGDLDGDGASDNAVLRLQCTGGALSAAHYGVVSPRDAASGLATGKRTHKPMKFVKEWGAATPQLAAIKPTYDVKKVEGSGARMMVDGADWTAVALANADGLCPAAAQAVKATKTRSNIQNN